MKFTPRKILEKNNLFEDFNDDEKKIFFENLVKNGKIEKNENFEENEKIEEFDIKDYNNIWDIRPRPPVDFEVRVVIWEVSGVQMADFEDTVDIFVTGCLPNLGKNEVHKTDVHYRSQDGYVKFFFNFS